MKLHNKGWLNNEIVTFLNLNEVQRKNKKEIIKENLYRLK